MRRASKRKRLLPERWISDDVKASIRVAHIAPEADTKPLEALFRAHVLKMLRKAGKIDEVWIRMLLGWKHSGCRACLGIGCAIGVPRRPAGKAGGGRIPAAVRNGRATQPAGMDRRTDRVSYSWTGPWQPPRQPHCPRRSRGPGGAVPVHPPQRLLGGEDDLRSRDRLGRLPLEHDTRGQQEEL